MSRIDAVLAQQCPDGVEFKRLGSVVRIRNGKDHKSLGAGEIPVYGTGGIMRYADAFAYDKPSVLIPRKGSLGNLFYVDVPFWNVDTIFHTEVDEEQINPKFLYYFLSTVGLGDMNQAGGVPSQTQSVLNEIKIPVPPLAIQQKIVAILDSFTELEARRSQYSHYRDSLLSLGELAMLGDIGTFTRGRRFTKDDYAPDGVGCIHYADIYTRYGTSVSATVSHVRADLASSLRFAKTGDIVIAAVGETVEDVGKAVAWLGEDDVAIHDDCFTFHHGQNPKFVSYCFQTAALNAEKNKFVARAKVKRLSGESLAKLRIPVPPLDEQARIVGILDKFDALVNDLSDGLPAEINARRQQYQHYRDRLLTFKMAA